MIEKKKKRREKEGAVRKDCSKKVWWEYFVH